MQLHFRKIGEGTPLIILHGLFGSSDNWQTLGKKFAENNFLVYLVDQRNHGHSPHSDFFSYKEMSEDILELMIAEKINPACFIGHSMGGKTAMEFSMLHPEKILKLIVVDIAPKKYPLQNKEVATALLEVDLTQIKSRKEVEAVLSKKIIDAGTLQFLLKNLYWKENDLLQWRFNLPVIADHLENTVSAIEFISPFEKPVLFIRGEKSNYILDSDLVNIKTFFPNAAIETAPGAGHWVHAENQLWFFEKCLNFLQ